MHSRVAAAMRAGVARLAARSGQSRLPRSRVFRLLRLLIFVLGAFAAGLYVAGAFDFERVMHRHAMHVGPGGFTLCGSANRMNCVVDGDTIHHQGIIIRVEGIDAPETHRAKCDSERALGLRATMRMLDLVNAGPFEIVRKGRRDTDKYGRELRDLQRDGRSFGDILIAEGLARRWDGRRRSWCGGSALRCRLRDRAPIRRV
jgi:endonuclease YncB( thermonuclease family)